MFSKILGAFVSGVTAVTVAYLILRLFPALSPPYGGDLFILGNAFFTAFFVSLIMYFGQSAFSKKAADQDLLVHVDVPPITDLSAIMLILDDVDRTILAALLKHGHFDPKTSAAKYKGPRIYVYTLGVFDICDESYRPHLLKVLSYT